MPRIQLSLRATQLKNAAGLLRGVSDPYAIVRITDRIHSEAELGRTESIKNTLEPKWTKIFFLDYDEGAILQIHVEVWDSNKSRDDAFMGEAGFVVNEIYNEHGRSKDATLTIKGDGNYGTLRAEVDDCSKKNATGNLILHLRALDLKNVDAGFLGIGQSDPFFEVERKSSDPNYGTVRWNTVYRSNFVEESRHPYWDECKIGVEELCFGDLLNPIQILVWDHQKNGKHKFIGQFEATPQRLMEQKAEKGNADRDKAFELLNGNRAGQGLIVVLKAQLEEAGLEDTGDD